MLVMFRLVQHGHLHRVLGMTSPGTGIAATRQSIPVRIKRTIGKLRVTPGDSGGDSEHVLIGAALGQYSVAKYRNEKDAVTLSNWLSVVEIQGVWAMP
jgi:hypothetical protein